LAGQQKGRGIGRKPLRWHSFIPLSRVT